MVIPPAARARSTDGSQTPPGVRWVPWLLLAVGVVLVLGAVVARSQLSLTTSRTVETSRTLEPAPRAAATTTRTVSETTGPPSDTLVGLAIGLGVSLVLAGGFYHRIVEVPLPGGIGSLKLQREPESQAFPPSEPGVVAPVDTPQPGGLPAALVQVRDQPALAHLRLAEVQEGLTPAREIRVAVLTVGLDGAVARHPAFAGRLDAPRSVGAAAPGTLMAGQVGLIAAMAPTARILPIGVFDETGNGGLVSVLQGASIAREQQADVVFLDFGFPPAWIAEAGDAFAAFRAIVDELTRTALVVAPAGNDGADAPQVPAALPGVLGVAALGETSRLAPFSSRGVGVAAPGVDVLTVEAVQDGGLVLSPRSGTSLAAGVAAGVAALVWSARPSLTGPALRDALIATGSPVAHAPAIRAIDLEPLLAAT